MSIIFEIYDAHYIENIYYFWYTYDGGIVMDRNSIDKKYQWDLGKIYENIDDFKKDIDFVKDKLFEFSKFEGIEYDEKSLYDVIKLCMDTSRVLEKLQVYTSLLCDEDTSINKNQELKEEIANLCSEYNKATYFIDTDILKLDYSYIEKLYKKNEKLLDYELYFKEMFRYKEHTLSNEEEKLLADLSLTFGNNYESYELLKDSDMSFPDFCVDMEDYELNNSNYSLYIEDDDRESDALVCAGMGGKLIIKILTEGMEQVLKMRELVLQPQSEIHLVREYLRKQGFYIDKEDIIFEDGKYYQVMHILIKSDKQNENNPLFDKFGPCLLKEKHPVLKNFLEYTKATLGEIGAHLASEEKTDKITKRIEELNKQQKEVSVALEYFND